MNHPECRGRPERFERPLVSGPWVERDAVLPKSKKREKGKRGGPRKGGSNLRVRQERH